VQQGLRTVEMPELVEVEQLLPQQEAQIQE
jgi:hypothetical protein